MVLNVPRVHATSVLCLQGEVAEGAAQTWIPSFWFYHVSRKNKQNTVSAQVAPPPEEQTLAEEQGSRVTQHMGIKAWANRPSSL